MKSATDAAAHTYEIPRCFDRELLGDFRDEAAFRITEAERALSRLASDPAAVEPLHSLFRALHTIKGTAGFLGLTHIIHFAHRIESFLDHFRSGRRPMQPGDVETARASVAMLALWLRDLDVTLARGRFIASAETDSLLSRMESSAPSALALAPTLRNLSRLLAELARESEKEIRLEIAGADLELESPLIEALAAALVHLIRNAADHGIESPAERERMGKPRAGCVRIEIVRENSSLLISLSDDGRGLNAEDILSRAVELGYANRDSALTDEVIHRLIFLPGLTTARSLTELSGRGVGLDVVRSVVETLRGSIEVTSQPALGTRFRLRIPLQ